jgi:hypothetical protein
MVIATLRERDARGTNATLGRGARGSTVWISIGSRLHAAPALSRALGRADSSRQFVMAEGGVRPADQGAESPDVMLLVVQHADDGDL